jgi:subfamily B ATP-binding cassette protein MsbA
MQDILKVLRFGLPYIRRYWLRFACGVVFGIIFGLSNAAFVGATTLLVSRLNSGGAFGMSAETVSQSGGLAAATAEKTQSAAVQPATPEQDNKKKSKPSSPFLAWMQKYWGAAVDDWLPRAGRPLEWDSWIGWKQIAGGILLLPILSLLRGGVGYLSSYCMAWTSRRVMVDLKQDVFNKLNSLSLDFHNRATTGDLLLRVNGDTGVLYGCLSLGLSDLIKEPLTIISVFLMLWSIDPQLTLLSMIFLPMCLIPTKILGNKVRAISKAGTTAGVNQASMLVEVFSNIRVVKAFGLEKQQSQQFAQTNLLESRMSMRAVQSKEMLNPIIETFSAFGIGVVLIYIFATGKPVANLIGFITGLGLFYAPLKKLAGIHLTFQQSSVGIDRLMEIISMQPTVQDAPNAKPVSGFNSALEFKRVTFSYGQEPVLRNISIAIPKGYKLGLAGESGSGKSSMVNLIFRFYDVNEGEILFDGVDIRKLKTDQMRMQMALVSQEVLLFNASVADNIAYGRMGATRQEVEEAARQASAHEFISQLPEGYDTKIGERGVRLSGGQRQRLAIARAFVRNAPILVLDEATASLDSQSEAEVQAAIDRLAENRTVISVAHRLSTLANCDEIIVLSKGEIIERGSFDELVNMKGAFSQMARKQGIHAPLAATS